MLESWSLFYGAKPFTLNDRLHHMERDALVKEWSGAFCQLARVARIPKALAHVTVSVTHHYKGARYVPDCDNAAPAAKAAIDGLKLAGVVADDGPRWVGPIHYEIPVIAASPGLELLVTAEAPTLPARSN